MAARQRQAVVPGRSRAAAGRGLLAVGLALTTLLGGCYQDEEPFPYGITSLAVLPTEVIPTDQLAGQFVSMHVSRALEDHSLFRVVGSESTERILSEPDGIELFDRFRTMAATAGVIDGRLARTLGDRMGVQALLFPRLALSLHGPTSGAMSLTLQAYETMQGSKIWQGYAQRSFAGHPGEPAFNHVLEDAVDDIISRMPRPAGERDE